MDEISKVWTFQCDRLCCEFLGYTETRFWEIVEGFYNTSIFEKNEFGEWALKGNISSMEAGNAIKAGILKVQNLSYSLER